MTDLQQNVYVFIQLQNRYTEKKRTKEKDFVYKKSGGQTKACDIL